MKKYQKIVTLFVSTRSFDLIFISTSIKINKTLEYYQLDVIDTFQVSTYDIICSFPKIYITNEPIENKRIK